MRDFWKKNSRCLHFFPGLIILVVGMFALHSSVKLADEHTMLGQYYTLVTAQQEATGSLDGTVQARQIEQLSNKIQKRENWLYWAVIATSLTAFVLLVLNADKLGALEKINAEKQEDLRLLTHRLAAIEASMDGIGIVDSDGNLAYMNTALMALHGIIPEQSGNYIGRSWLNLYSQKGREHVEKEILPEFEKGVFWHGTSKIVRLDGKVIDVDLTMTKLEGGGFIGTARDISEQKRADAEKKEMEKQLFQAQKLEAVGRLAGGIAHDFNNILAAINGYAEFLIEDLRESPEQQKFAKNIFKAGAQARSLVDKILAFSRYDTNEMQVLNMLTPLEESISMIEATLPKTINIVTDIQVEKAYVEGNATQIAQMIMNLCVNARDAMEGDKGNIIVSLNVADTNNVPEFFVLETLPDAEQTQLIRMLDEEDSRTVLYMGNLARGVDYMKLSIGDSGSGMSKVIMERIFEPFFTTKDVNKGTGLGLPMVHGTMIAHNGALVIDSALNQGTRFDLYFPISHEKEILSEQLKEGASIIHSAKVLLVEDQADVRLMTETMLVRSGHVVDVAENGLDALDLLREAPGEYDLVLTDQNMPKMTGLELVNETYIDFPDIPFILLSGYSEERLHAFMKEHPSIKSTLRKPVSRKDLITEIASVLSTQPIVKDSAA